MVKTVNFFENKGLERLRTDDRALVWYADFLEFVKENEIFSTLLTPASHGDKSDSRWDTWRNCGFNEITSFYGLHYWYTWQVSILGLGPIWISKNEGIKRKTARLLRNGGIFGFGLSEKEHGADVYSTEMALTAKGDGTYLANGRKYYIGNGNVAALVSTLGKIKPQDDFVFFTVDSSHDRYECVKNIINSQSFVAEYALDDYPITDDDILHVGSEAWDAALNTVNIGKFNLGWASIGIGTHAFYEALNHAAGRNLYGKFVTDFPHIRRLLTDAYCRLVAMKLFALRASDYMRSASSEDRRYLLFNPIVKMKVTTEGERVIDLLWDVIAAKGFENDTYFEMATRAIRFLPKLEGTVHVNMVLVTKFVRSFFFAPKDYAKVPQVKEAKNDDFLFDQGPARGLGKIQFQDYRPILDRPNLPNTNLFKQQVAVFREMLGSAPPTKEQESDIDFMLCAGELFTLIVYAQLIIENREFYPIDDDLMDQIFDLIVRDFSRYALDLYSKPVCTAGQMDFCLKMIRRPVVDPGRFDRIWSSQVRALRDVYAMRP